MDVSERVNENTLRGQRRQTIVRGSMDMMAEEPLARRRKQSCDSKVYRASVPF